MTRPTKQVIILRTDLRNKDGHKIRTGKYVTQGAHASLKAILDRGRKLADNDILVLPITPAMASWMSDGLYTKITLGAESLEQLMDIYEKTVQSGLPSSIITDAGLTEFTEPTITAVAIGPAYSDEIDPITKHLKLL